MKGKDKQRQRNRESMRKTRKTKKEKTQKRARESGRCFPCENNNQPCNKAQPCSECKHPQLDRCIYFKKPPSEWLKKILNPEEPPQAQPSPQRQGISMHSSPIQAPIGGPQRSTEQQGPARGQARGIGGSNPRKPWAQSSHDADPPILHTQVFPSKVSKPKAAMAKATKQNQTGLSTAPMAPQSGVRVWRADNAIPQASVRRPGLLHGLTEERTPQETSLVDRIMRQKKDEAGMSDASVQQPSLQKSVINSILGSQRNTTSLQQNAAAYRYSSTANGESTRQRRSLSPSPGPRPAAMPTRPQLGHFTGDEAALPPPLQRRMTAMSLSDDDDHTGATKPGTVMPSGQSRTCNDRQKRATVGPLFGRDSK